MRYRSPRRLAYVIARDDGKEPCLYLMTLPLGPPRLICGPAAVIWAVAADEVDDVVADVADVYGRSPAEVESTVLSYLDHLVGLGCLEPVEPQGSTAAG